MVTPGTRLGPYEILGSLGAGGMGEVYRARDGKLNRDVAIKLLPSAVAADRDRLARFEREAQTLASLNHPNIAQIFGVLDEPPALVMEFVDGEDLARRLARSAIPLDEGLPIARQLAEALAAAHEQGIVHRDLKPANIMLRPDGTVKVLDFGLAKATGQDSGSSARIADSPTFTAPATQVGMIVGTAAYMAPEQARGRAVDRRADVWAFGAVFFEMVTGRRAFDGEEISDVLAAVLKSEPSWSAMPAGTPASIGRLLRRCLEKDPRRRLSAIGDARLELDDAERPPALEAASARRMPLLAAVLAGALAIAVGVVGWLAWGPREPAPVRRFSLLAPPGVSIYPDSGTLAISPDGTMVAFTVGTPVTSGEDLWIRRLDSLEARKVEGVDAVRLPFWSPDSRTIGFFSDTKLMTVPAAGGRPRMLADVKGPGRGAAWGVGDVIVFAPDTSGPLYRINAGGGTPVQVTTLDAARNQFAHRFPTFLPDGDHFLYAALPSRNGRFDIFAGSLSGGPPVLIGAMENSPVYADGYLLSTRQGVLVAQSFDARSMKTAGEPIALGDEPSVYLDPAIAYTASHAASAAVNGSLAYYSSPSQNVTPQWYDVSGRLTGTLQLPPGHYDTIRISPDGTQAVAVRSVSPSESTLWLVDIAHGGAVLLSTGPGRNDHPVWSPDGSKIVFASDRDGAADFFVKTIGDSVPEQPFFTSPAVFKSPNAWSPDGKWIVFTQLDPGAGQDIWLLDANHPSAPRLLVNGPKRDMAGAVSPDGRWLAYYSDETGRMQLYVMPFPGGGRRVQVSRDGCSGASWSPDGRSLLFVGLDGRTVWQADVQAGPAFSAGTPRAVGQVPGDVADWSPDGPRFIVLMPEKRGPGSLTVVQNWRAALAEHR